MPSTKNDTGINMKCSVSTLLFTVSFALIPYLTEAFQSITPSLRPVSPLSSITFHKTQLHNYHLISIDNSRPKPVLGISYSTRLYASSKSDTKKNFSKIGKKIEKKNGSSLNGAHQPTTDTSSKQNETAIHDPEEILILQDDLAAREELEAAVKEVKEVFTEVTESTGKLTGTIIEKGPGIFTRFMRTLVSKEMRYDFARRKKHYVSDWTDAFENKRQVVPAILFLFFACLAPAVSFGTISTELTNGSIGVVEFLLSSGLSGMAYACLSGQPMAFIAPTGLTLAFISGLFRFCTLRAVPFFPVYSWVGIWTSFFMISLGMAGSSKLIKYCTRFTDEVFNALLSLNFIYEASSSLRRNFLLSNPNNLTMPFVSLAMALATFGSTMKVIAFDKTRYMNKQVRSMVKDFGPVAIIFLMSMINALPIVKKWHVPTLVVPSAFELSGGRDFLIDIFAIPMKVRFLCALPAVLLTSLFFMDQNISVRLVNNEENHLKKGAAYNMDMVALGAVTAGLSIVGLPWMCGATVQSMNHVRAMTKTKFNPETEQLEVESVTETRTSGFIIHAMIASTVFLLPSLKYLPIPVVSGVFLFLGRKLMTGNSFLSRVKDIFAETARLPDDHCIKLIGRKKVVLFTLLQVACLMALWGFKSCSATAIFFPSVIGMLMVIRSLILPKLMTEEEFVVLGDATP